MSKQPTAALPPPPLPIVRPTAPAVPVAKPAAPAVPIPVAQPLPSPASSAAPLPAATPAQMVAPAGGQLTAPAGFGSMFSGSGESPTPPPSGPSVPIAPTTSPSTVGVATPLPVPGVQPAGVAPAMPLSSPAFTPPMVAPTPGSAAPIALTPPTGTGSTNPPGLAAPTTAGVPLEEALQKGLKGSQMFGEPPKSGTSEVGQGSGPSPAQPQTAAAPIVLPARAGFEAANPPPAVHVHPAVAKDIGPAAAAKTREQLAQKVRQNIATPAPSKSSNTSDEGQRVSDVLAFMLEVDGALLDMPIEGEEEALAYLELTADIPWAKQTEKQRYTRTVAFSVWVAAKQARHLMLRAILDGEEPIGLSVHLPAYPPAETAEERDRQTADAAARLGLPASDRLVTPQLDPAYSELPPQGGHELDLNQGPPYNNPEWAAAADAGLIWPDGTDPSEDTDEGLDDGPVSKADAPSYSGQDGAAKYDGPVTPTGIKLLPDTIRPIVVTFLRTKDIAKQADIERQLGLDITNSHADVKGALNDLKHGNEIQEGRFNAIADNVTTALVNEGTRQWKQAQEQRAANAAPAGVPALSASNVETQMALMRQECRNTAAGCTGKRHSHRNAKGQCFDKNCHCRGRCEQFVPPSGGGESKSDGPDGGSVAGVAATGVSGPGSSPVPVAGVGGGQIGGGRVPSYLTAPEYIRKRMTELSCVRPTDNTGHVCGWNADCHRLYTGPLITSGGSQGAHVACEGFMPKAEEREEYVALIQKARELALNVGEWKGDEDDGARPKSDAPVDGRDGDGSAGNVAGPALPAPAPVQSTAAGVGGTLPGPASQLPPLPPGAAAPGQPRGPATLPKGAQAGPEGHDAGVHDEQGQGAYVGADTATLEKYASEMSLDEVNEQLIWRGGLALDGEYTPPDESDAPDTPNYWPVPASVVTEGGVAERRDGMATRIINWWAIAVTEELKQGPDTPGRRVVKGKYKLKSKSYRVVLAAKELSAQLERYAMAPLNAGSPPEVELVQAVSGAAIKYLEAHITTTEPDTDFATYMEACTMYGLEVGTSWAEIQAALPQEGDEPVF